MLYEMNGRLLLVITREFEMFVSNASDKVLLEKLRQIEREYRESLNQVEEVEDVLTVQQSLIDRSRVFMEIIRVELKRRKNPE